MSSFLLHVNIVCVLEIIFCPSGMRTYSIWSHFSGICMTCLICSHVLWVVGVEGTLLHGHSKGWKLYNFDITGMLWTVKELGFGVIWNISGLGFSEICFFRAFVEYLMSTSTEKCKCTPMTNHQLRQFPYKDIKKENDIRICR